MTETVDVQSVPGAVTPGTSQGTGNGNGALARGAKVARSRQVGELPRRLAWLRPAIEGFRAGLVADKGGPELVTVAEGALIDQAARLLTIITLMTGNVAARGAVTRQGEVRAPLNALAAYENSFRHCLTALGLERRAKDAMTLTDYLADRAAICPGGNGNGDGPEAQGLNDRGPGGNLSGESA